MRILWLNSGLLGDACAVCGYDKVGACSWTQAMIDELVAVAPEIKFCIVSLDYRHCDVSIENVRHVSIQGRFTYNKTPLVIQERIRCIIKEFDPDVIHVQGTEYFYGCMDRSVYCGKPVVVSIQGVLSGIWPNVTGGLTRKDMRRAQLNPRFFLKGQTLFTEQNFWREMRAEQEARVFRSQCNFIGRTEWDRQWMEYYNHAARYFHVNESLRKPFYAVRRTAGSVRRHTIYCGAAASCALKGFHWLMRAVAALKDEFPDMQVRVAAADIYFSRPHSIGEYVRGQAYHSYLRSEVKRLGVGENIIALPTLSAEEVANELAKAELFVLPSMCENSPNSLGEAMLVGTPSIATFVGGVPSIMKNGVEGKLIPSGDPAALAGAIRRWFLHPEEAEACVAPARATALKRHDARTNAEATLAVYGELMGT